MMTNDITRNRDIPPGETTGGARLRINLGKEAVKLALSGDWERAVEVNRAILDLLPEDCETGNRLAKALMELGDYAEAGRVLEELCRLSPTNTIAHKNLSRLRKLESTGSGQRQSAVNRAQPTGNFIEDGGKSCTTTLRRRGEPSVLTRVAAGDPVVLAVQNHSVVVTARDGQYLGLVEPRLARRLRKLIDGGNEYSADVVTIRADKLSVIIRETGQHPSLRNVVSFPTTSRTSVTNAEPDPLNYDRVESPASEVEPDSSEMIELVVDAEQESTAVACLADEIEDDAGSDAEDGVPMLDTDAEPNELPRFVRIEDQDWE